MLIYTKRARRLSPSGSSFPVGLRFALFAEKREHGSGRDGCADDSRDVRPHRVHEDVGAGEFLLDDLLADARRHRDGGDARSAYDGVDLSAGHDFHDLSEDYSARGAEYEGYEPEADYLDCRDGQEGLGLHRRADALGAVPDPFAPIAPDPAQAVPVPKTMTREQIAASGVSPADLEGITGLPRKIEGVQVGVTLRQQPSGSFKISVRTVKGVDACAIARRLGGGGHGQAAGCELEGNLENAKAAVLAEVEKELERADAAAREAGAE